MSTVLALGVLGEPEEPELSILYWTGENWELLQEGGGDNSLGSLWDRMLGRDAGEDVVVGSPVSVAYDTRRGELIVFGLDTDRDPATWRLKTSIDDEPNGGTACNGCGCRANQSAKSENHPASSPTS